MGELKAIETRYKGYRFRSRLEARWAVFFDALGVEWEYEKEGYDLGEAGWYLPDFWLPGLDCFVEVKGVKPTKDECNKARALYLSSGRAVIIETGLPLEGFCRSWHTPRYSVYLAGKIAQKDWRSELVPELVDFGPNGPASCGHAQHCGCQEPGEHEWGIIEAGVLGYHNYTGPFYRPHSDGISDHATSPVDFGWKGHYTQLSRPYTWKLNTDAIRASDLVFAWVDTLDCYGTMAEIGYARGIAERPLVVVGKPSLDEREDWVESDDHTWFVEEFADYVVYGATPAEAFAEWITTPCSWVCSAAWNSSRQPVSLLSGHPSGNVIRTNLWHDPNTQRAHVTAIDAARKARSARFEHGEAG